MSVLRPTGRHARVVPGYRSPGIAGMTGWVVGRGFGVHHDRS